MLLSNYNQLFWDNLFWDDLYFTKAQKNRYKEV